MRMGCNVRSYTDYGIFVPSQGKHTFDCHPRQQVSIFNFTAKHIQSTGLAYPLYDFTTWWQGTLNRCTGDAFSVEAEGEYIVFLAYE